MDGPLENQRILFAVPLDESGVNHGYYDLLAYLRTHPGCLDGSVGGVLVDGEKAAAPTVSFTAEQLAKGIVIKKGKKIYHKVTL